MVESSLWGSLDAHQKRVKTAKGGFREVNRDLVGSAEKTNLNLVSKQGCQCFIFAKKCKIKILSSFELIT